MFASSFLRLWPAVLLVLTACTAGDDPGPPAPASDDGLWAQGAIHAHSRYTDGAGTMDDIASAAGRAGLDFVIVTDHWSLDGLLEGEERYREGVLQLVGVEASSEFGHLLGFDLPPAPLRFNRQDAAEVLAQIDALGGFAIVAHPTAGADGLGWTGWDLPGYAGLEVFNAYSAYLREGALGSLGHLLGISGGPEPDSHLSGIWDSELSRGPLVGWAGADAHGGIELAEGRFLRWPTYERIFRMVQNHLLLSAPLTGDVAHDRQLVYEALRAGRGYVSVGESAADVGFEFFAVTDRGEEAMGSEIALPVGGTFRLRAGVGDPNARLILVGNGVRVLETTGGELEFETREPGAYRVEAHLEGGWILSNAVAVVEEERLAERRLAREVPEQPTLRGSTVRPYPLVLGVEPTGGCRSLELERGGSGAGSFRARFSLGAPSRGEPDTVNAPWGRCALADRRPHDLGGEEGIRFEVRGDAIYRVSLFLADRDPDTGSQAFWTTSFLTGEDWREISIPFSQLRGISRPRRPLGLSAVSEISFFFDTSNTRPGTSGEVELRAVELVTVP